MSNKPSKLLKLVAAIYIIALFFFSWGFATGNSKIFPWVLYDKYYSEIKNFLIGGEGDSQLNLFQKIQNDQGIKPFRQLVSPEQTLEISGCNGLFTRMQKNADTCEIFNDKKTSGYLSYGPYIDLKPGYYEVEYTLSIDAEENIEVGHIDAINGPKSDNVLFSAPLYGTAAVEKSIKFDLDLKNDSPTNNFEARVFLKKNVNASVKHLIIKKIGKSNRIYRSLEIKAKKQRRINPNIYIRDNALFPNGYLAILGTIDGKAGMHGFMVLNADGKVIHEIEIKDKLIKKRYNSIKSLTEPWSAEENRSPHGLEILKDGSIVFNDGDPGNSMRRIDWCGNEIWTDFALTHHSVSLYNNTLYTCAKIGTDGDAIEQRNISDGKNIRSITIKDIINANKDIGIFNIRHNIREGNTLPDPYHLNDIQALPKYLASAFPQFNEGDLLLSYRSLNLVTVIDKESLKVKWWVQGLTIRQHDPDWQADGTITIFDNMMVSKKSFGASRIVSIDPKTNKSRILYSGENDNIYTWMRGKHQVLPNSSIILTLPMQGRVIGVDKEGISFDFNNKYDDHHSLLVSDAVYLDNQFFDFDPNKMRCNEVRKP